MNFIKKPLVFLALAFLIMPAYSFAQYQFTCDPFFSYFKDLRRYEIGLGVVLPGAEFNGVTQVNTPTPYYYRGDTTVKRKLTGGQGFGLTIGLSAPFKKTGHISCWAMDVQLMLNYYSWVKLNQTYGIDGSYTDPIAGNEISATSYQVALPLGVEYKIGCDAAVLTKRLNLCGTFGGGFIPQMWMTNITTVSTFDNQFAFGVTPYAKIEGGFFLGWCFKVRLMYTMGRINLFDANKAIPSTNGSGQPLTDGPFGFTSTSNFMASLIIMPFSGRWSETQWYNTYDTYQPHDRLN